jgi:hypothetical protein
MAIDIKYFNSFILRKTITASSGATAQYLPVWPGLPSDPDDLPEYPVTTPSPRVKYTTNLPDFNTRNWIIEEARIRGGYNNTSVGYGVRAYLNEKNKEQSHLVNSLIYSGIYNSRTLINNTNVFSVGEQITKSVDPLYGSIQKIHALDSNLAIFQENKISNALIDKDIIYTTEGTGSLAASQSPIGSITPYVGDYGISTNPESFAYFGYRRYFSDRRRNSVMRLSRDGLTEISQYGMADFFKDELANISETLKPVNYKFTRAFYSTSPSPWVSVNTIADVNNIEIGMQITIPQGVGNDIIGVVEGFVYDPAYSKIYLNVDPGTPVTTPDAIILTKFVKDKIVGGYDVHSNNYLISLEANATQSQPEKYSTLAFEDVSNGWVSFFDYKPTFSFSLYNKFYTTTGSEIYEHYSNSVRNNFYGVSYGSSIEFIFNANPSIIKNFKTINYEGSNGWEVETFQSDSEGPDSGVTYLDKAKTVRSYDEGLYNEGGVPYRAGFNRKENKYFANLINNSVARPGEVFFGDATTGIKGYLATVKVSTDATTDPGGTKELFAVSTEFVVSSR